MLLSLEGNFQLIKTADGTEFYWPETGINTLQTIKPGYSYLIYLKENALFLFRLVQISESGVSKSVLHFQFVVVFIEKMIL